MLFYTSHFLHDPYILIDSLPPCTECTYVIDDLRIASAKDKKPDMRFGGSVRMVFTDSDGRDWVRTRSALILGNPEWDLSTSSAAEAKRWLYALDWRDRRAAPCGDGAGG